METNNKVDNIEKQIENIERKLANLSELLHNLQEKKRRIEFAEEQRNLAKLRKEQKSKMEQVSVQRGTQVPHTEQC
jgi:prefoldin subunit 5